MLVLYRTGMGYRPTSDRQEALPGRTYPVAGLLVMGVVLLGGYLLYQYDRDRSIVRIGSDREVLRMLWDTYKEHYWDADTGRTRDLSRGGITTSEGQSYTLLRAVSMDDRETFDRTLAWTDENLRREEDALYAWLYGVRADGTEGVIEEQGGNNTATDADTDIALALIFAYSRWLERSYLERALTLLEDIWEHEVFMIDGRPYLSAHNILPDETFILVNPSYLSPYAYRIFAEIDTSRDWIGLVDTSYDVLLRSMDEPLDTGNSVGLPPDWVELDRSTAALSRSREPQLTTHYGYEAMRVPFRIALDRAWYDEPRAEEVLSRLSFLRHEFERTGKLMGSYDHAGRVVGDYEDPAMYGGAIGAFLVGDPRVAERLYREKVRPQAYRRDDTDELLQYYENNLLWFGIALYTGAFENLYELNKRI